MSTTGTATTTGPHDSRAEKSTNHIEADIHSDENPTEVDHYRSPISYGTYVRYLFPRSDYPAPLASDLERFLSKIPEGQAKEDLRSVLAGKEVVTDSDLRTVRIASDYPSIGGWRTEVKKIFPRSGQRVEGIKDLPLVE